MFVFVCVFVCSSHCMRVFWQVFVCLCVFVRALNIDRQIVTSMSVLSVLVKQSICSFFVNHIKHVFLFKRAKGSFIWLLMDVASTPWNFLRLYVVLQASPSYRPFGGFRQWLADISWYKGVACILGTTGITIKTPKQCYATVMGLCIFLCFEVVIQGQSGQSQSSTPTNSNAAYIWGRILIHYLDMNCQNAQQPRVDAAQEWLTVQNYRPDYWIDPWFEIFVIWTAVLLFCQSWRPPHWGLLSSLLLVCKTQTSFWFDLVLLLETVV